MKNILKHYIYQTGHGKGLAKAEIEALMSHPDAILDEVEDGFVVEGFLPDAKAALNGMGGIVRICEVLQTGPAGMPLNFEQWLTQALESEFKGYKGKMRYGLSMHPKNEKTIKTLLIGAKKAVKELGNVRFVNKDFQNLSSVQAWHEHLLERGAVELHLFKSDTKWYLARTLAIQDFEWYSKRDFGRPSKDAKNGMFPPKLAQILINLAQPAQGATIVDPFCGSGTVLQEAVLMGHPAWGMDLELSMIRDTKLNLDWLMEQREFGEEKMPYMTMQADATELTAGDLPPPPFCIVTETWLGPRLTKMPTPDELKLIQDSVEELLEKFFANLKKITKEPITVVFTAPFHKERNDRHFLPNLPAILKKYTTIVPLSEHERPSFFYERKDQNVAREIWKVRVG
ncbi:MAG: DNA methyltransferase [Patescibacteria group bacterium]